MNNLTIDKLYASDRGLFFFADSKAFKKQMRGILKENNRPQFQHLFDYYNFLNVDNDRKFNRPSNRHLDMKPYAHYPIDYICYYLSLLGFEDMLDMRGNDEKWWLRSLPELESVKPLTGNDAADHQIVEDWILSVPMHQYSPSRNGMILLGIYGMRLIKYFWSKENKKQQKQ